MQVEDVGGGHLGMVAVGWLAGMRALQRRKLPATDDQRTHPNWRNAVVVLITKDAKRYRR